MDLAKNLADKVMRLGQAANSMDRGSEVHSAFPVRANRALEENRNEGGSIQMTGVIEGPGLQVAPVSSQSSRDGPS